MGHIDWIPIAEMPDALKDGRRVLVAEGKAINVACYLDGSRGDDPGWYVMHEYPIDPAHFAEINPPAGG